MRFHLICLREIVFSSFETSEQEKRHWFEVCSGDFLLIPLWLYGVRHTHITKNMENGSIILISIGSIPSKISISSVGVKSSIIVRIYVSSNGRRYSEIITWQQKHFILPSSKMVVGVSRLGLIEHQPLCKSRICDESIEDYSPVRSIDKDKIESDMTQAREDESGEKYGNISPWEYAIW